MACMIWHKRPTLALTGASLLALLGLSAITVPAEAARENDARAQGTWRQKADPWVLRTAASGETEFLVVLNEQADLSPAASLRGKAERGRFVFERLTATARRTQGPLLEELDRAGAEHRPFWIVNMIWVRGGEDVVEAMAQRPEVARLDGNRQVAFDGPVGRGRAPGASANVEWNIEQVDADDVWALGFNGQEVVIAGQDTGYDWDHPALREQYRGWDGDSADHDYDWHDAIHSGGGSCGADSPEPCDDGSHGTHTMGTMVGDDGGGNQVGMAPGARWIGCRNMDQGNGTPATYSECFEWFVAPTDLEGENPDPDKAPHVINNSWSCPPSEGCAHDTLKTVVENTRAAGIVVAAAAGNSGSGCSTVSDPPMIYEATFSIGATDSSDTIAGFSSRGPVTIDGSGRMKPNVSAPGVGVRSSVPGGGYGSSSGTSMASPHVSGLVALAISIDPNLAGDVDLIEALIEQTALPRMTTQSCGGVPGDEVPNNTYGWGRIDALTLATLLLEQMPSLSFTPSTLDFGDVQVGTTSDPMSATLENTGGSAANDLVFGVPGNGFEAESDCGSTLDAGASCEVTVAFTPPTSGPVTAVLEVGSAEGASADLELMGDGTSVFTAMSLAVDDTAALLADGNGVFEPGEAVEVAPTWRNDNEGGGSENLMGTASGFTGPASGSLYEIVNGDADYGSVAPGAEASCAATGDCYTLSVFDPSVRPLQHWDAVFDETTTTEAQKTWILHLGDSFTDVPRSSPFYRSIETLLHSGVTGGCTGTTYCPGASNTRGQMPVFVLKALEGPDYVPPACVEGDEVFGDLPSTSLFCPWIEELANRNLIAGCGDGDYCPENPVTRAQMAVFLLKTLEGGSYVPPECTGEFADVPCPSTFADWIEELYHREVTGGCGSVPLMYCPAAAVSRAQMAAFVTQTFALTLYGP